LNTAFPEGMSITESSVSVFALIPACLAATSCEVPECPFRESQ
jgi:hypothetical protein